MGMVSEVMNPHVHKETTDQPGTNPISSLDSHSPKSLLVAFANVLIIIFSAGKPRATPPAMVVVISCMIHASYKEFQMKQMIGALVLLKQFTIKCFKGKKQQTALLNSMFLLQ